MDFKKQKNFIFIGIAFAAVLSGYLIFRYFDFSSYKNGTEADATKSTIPSKIAGESIFAEEDAASSGRQNVFAERARGADGILDAEDFGDMNIQEIHNLVSALEQTKLDIGFFESEQFIKLIDFSKEVELLESDKGNIYPFSPI